MPGGGGGLSEELKGNGRGGDSGAGGGNFEDGSIDGDGLEVKLNVLPSVLLELSVLVFAGAQTAAIGVADVVFDLMLHTLGLPVRSLHERVHYCKPKLTGSVAQTM